MKNPSPHPAVLPPEALQSQCDVKRTRAGGPGGQHRNKVDTAIVLTHRPTGIVATASEKRSQHANLKQALQRLRLNLAIGVRSDPVPVLPPVLWTDRVDNRRIRVSEQHDDFPGVIVVAMDYLEAHQHRVAEAARSLGVSTSQFIKLLQTSSQVWESVQRVREERGLPRLK